ncbi:hypothetical protein O6H91_14G039400 [Diphasiastrum complanatum]|uniref:Uncharacterized protein n=1 Tax=Diphasiastrum complanatum TaxID=34168 RepID=A0ACC2BND4_DIPCM|nr:hypothetical protein O6H91_14G039400 [Diphasiastrum complanatum]
MEDDQHLDAPPLSPSFASPYPMASSPPFCNNSAPITDAALPEPMDTQEDPAPPGVVSDSSPSSIAFQFSSSPPVALSEMASLPRFVPPSSVLLAPIPTLPASLDSTSSNDLNSAQLGPVAPSGIPSTAPVIPSAAPVIPPAFPPSAPLIPSAAPVISSVMPPPPPPIISSVMPPAPMGPPRIASLPPIPPPPVFVPRNEGIAKEQAERDVQKDSNMSNASGDSENLEEYQVSEESRKARERQEQLVQQLMMRRRASALAVPTNDAAVRSRLRTLNQPITLFGEREMERRDRLRAVMAKLDADGELEKLLKAQEVSTDTGAAEGHAADEMQEMEAVQTQPFYTEGSSDLLQARIQIMKYSLVRAASRISRAKRKREGVDEDEEAEFDYVLQGMAQTTMDCSEIGDERPLSGCAFSPDSTLLATSGWSGITKVWSIPDVQKVGTLKGHSERITAVAFSPDARIIATASADRTAILWDTEGFQQRRTLEGHLDRLARVAFHPSGAYLGTTSFDKTWRLWDVNTGIELLLQEGHSRSVYGIAFQKDGSLAASCGLDGLARVWDLRTGRSILALEGHVKAVLGVDFSPNGYHLATGSEDHTCRIWDLRKRQSLYIIPAHSSLISQVKYEPQEGYFLVTTSYDNTARVGDSENYYFLIIHEVFVHNR